MRPELWETVVDLVGSAMPDDEAQNVVRVTSIWLDVPIEVTMRSGARTSEEVKVLAHLPRWRWTTVFDDQRGRLKLFCRWVEQL